MKTNRYLLPTSYKLIGWILTALSAIALMYYLFIWTPPASPGSFIFFTDKVWPKVLNLFNVDYIWGSISMLVLVVGLLCMAFSKEKQEDEFIAKLRGDSLIWAMIVNAVLLILCAVIFYEGGMLYVAFFNMYAFLILYLIKFSVTMYRFRKQAEKEDRFSELDS